MNTQLLDDDVFVDTVTEELDNLISTKAECIAIQWEEFKQKVKIKAIERSSVIRYNLKQAETKLRQQLVFFISMESDGPGLYVNEIKEVKSELETVDSHKYKAAVVTSRSEKLWAGEMPTKRALSDEKRCACRKEIHQLAIGHDITCDKNEIKQGIVDHFKALLGYPREVKDGYQKEFLLLMPKFDEEVRARLEQPITFSEIECAVDELATSKAPGPDGLGAKFYKAFKSALAQVLHLVISEAYERKRLPLSFTTSHIVLIPKSDDEKKTPVARVISPDNSCKRRLQDIHKNFSETTAMCY